MQLSEIQDKADFFFDWPTEDKRYVTTTSALLFAQKCVDDAETSAEKRILELESAITKTLNENGHLADGDVCTLIDLKRVIPDWELE